MRVGAVDIGGTFLKTGIFDGSGFSGLGETPSQGQLGGGHIVRRVVETLEAMGPLDCIGISTAGQVDAAAGAIKYANPNIPDYTGTRLRDILEDRFQVPVAVENDVNAAAVGEAWYGAAAGQPRKNFLCLTYGTGVGGAIFQDDRLYYGSNYSAGEVGHLITHAEKMTPGASHLAGAYETYASATALVRLVRQADPALDDGRKIFAALDRPEIRRLVDAWIGEILCGLASLIYMWNPSLIVLGGGVMKAPYLIEALRRRLPDYVLPGHLPVELQPARLGNRAGMMGAVHLALQRVEQLKM